MGLVRSKRLGSSGLKHYSEFVNGSTCQVQIKRHLDGNLSAMKIILGGLASKIPAKSNDQRAQMRRMVSKTGQSKYVPFVRCSENVLAEMEGLKDMFINTVSNSQKIASFNFDTHPIHVQVGLAAQPGTWDSHNCCKAIGDFLQGVGITANDKYCQIWCYKLTDYPHLVLDGATIESTIITINRADYIKELLTDINLKLTE